MLFLSPSYIYTYLFGSFNLILFSQGEAVIHYNKLQADPKQGKSLDIGIYIYVTFFEACTAVLCTAFLQNLNKSFSLLR